MAGDGLPSGPVRLRKRHQFPPRDVPPVSTAGARGSGPLSITRFGGLRRDPTWHAVRANWASIGEYPASPPLSFPCPAEHIYRDPQGLPWSRPLRRCVRHPPKPGGRRAVWPREWAPSAPCPTTAMAPAVRTPLDHATWSQTAEDRKAGPIGKSKIHAGNRSGRRPSGGTDNHVAVFRWSGRCGRPFPRGRPCPQQRGIRSPMVWCSEANITRTHLSSRMAQRSSNRQDLRRKTTGSAQQLAWANRFQETRITKNRPARERESAGAQRLAPAR